MKEEKGVNPAINIALEMLSNNSAVKMLGEVLKGVPIEKIKDILGITGLKHITFCEECRKETKYDIISQEEEINLKGTKFTAVQFAAICKECKHEVYVPSIHDYNLDIVYEKYNKIKRGESK
jgi:hypothetical protein